MSLYMKSKTFLQRGIKPVIVKNNRIKIRNEEDSRHTEHDENITFRETQIYRAHVTIHDKHVT